MSIVTALIIRCAARACPCSCDEREKIREHVIDECCSLSNIRICIYIYLFIYLFIYESIGQDIINKDAMDIYACSTRNIIGTHRFRHVKLDSWSTWPLAGCTCQTAFFHHPLPTSRDIFFSFILRATSVRYAEF